MRLALYTLLKPSFAHAYGPCALCPVKRLDLAPDVRCAQCASMGVDIKPDSL